MFVVKNGRLMKFNVRWRAWQWKQAGYFGAVLEPASPMTTFEFVVENGGVLGLRLPAVWADPLFKQWEVPRRMSQTSRGRHSDARRVQADRDRRAQRREKRVQQEALLQ